MARIFFILLAFFVAVFAQKKGAFIGPAIGGNCPDGMITGTDPGTTEEEGCYASVNFEVNMGPSIDGTCPGGFTLVGETCFGNN